MFALALLVLQWTERFRSHCRWVLMVVWGGRDFVAKGTEGPETAVPDEREQRGEDTFTRDGFSCSDSRRSL